MHRSSEHEGNVLPFTPEREGALCLFAAQGLEVFIFKRETQDWGLTPFLQGALCYGLYVSQEIPFFLLHIQGFAELAVAVNVLAQPADRRHDFLNLSGEGGVRLLLHGFPRPAALAERLFRARGDVLEEIRQVAQAQILAYADPQASAAASARILAAFPAARMMRSTVLYPERRTF